VTVLVPERDKTSILAPAEEAKLFAAINVCAA